MPARSDLVFWFSEVDRNDAHLVGDKGAMLGDMVSAGFPVPQGFVVSSRAYFTFFRENNLSTKIKHLLSTANFAHSESMYQISQHIQHLIMESDQSTKLINEVSSKYTKLGGLFREPVVAMRTSTSHSDVSPAHSAHISFLNIQGDANILYKIKEMWASLFSVDAISYRQEHHIDHFRASTAIIIQRMVASEASGLMYTTDPTNNDKSLITIEAIYGLSELLLKKNITPDHYEVNKLDLHILKKNIAPQDVFLKKTGRENKKEAVDKKARTKQKIADIQIKELADLGRKMEHHYYFPQDVEWAIDDQKIYILQARPSTPIGIKKVEEKGATKQLSEILPIQTRTKIYANLYEPEVAEKIRFYPIDGIGIFHGESLIKSYGIHPKKMLHDGRRKEYIAALADKIELVCHPLNPRPVIYKVSNLTTDQYRSLIGGKSYEPVESNPLLGYHGAFRYIHDPDVFELELEAVKLIRTKRGMKNLWLMLTGVRTVRELLDLKKIISSVGLYRSPTFKLFVGIDFPSSMLSIDKLATVGIDGIHISIDDVMMYLLGIDRKNSEVAHVLDIPHEVVTQAIHRTITSAREHRVEVCVSSNTRHVLLNELENIMQAGVTSLSVPPDMVAMIREHVATIEKK